jgi:hypothetical protein
MKARPVAALALVGWYLMVPPPSSGVDWHIRATAPLNQWLVAHTFDTAKECEDYHTLVLQQVKGKTSINPQNGDEAAATGMSLSQCIASDDPRLKGNWKCRCQFTNVPNAIRSSKPEGRAN